jgi:hypothetical protein
MGTNGPCKNLKLKTWDTPLTAEFISRSQVFVLSRKPDHRHYMSLKGCTTDTFSRIGTSSPLVSLSTFLVLSHFLITGGDCFDFETAYLSPTLSNAVPGSVSAKVNCVLLP